MDEINGQLQYVFIRVFRVYQNLYGYKKLYSGCIHICAPFTSQTDRFCPYTKNCQGFADFVKSGFLNWGMQQVDLKELELMLSNI